MAQTKKKTTKTAASKRTARGSARNTKKGGSARGRSAKKRGSRSGGGRLRIEIIELLVLAVCILLMLSNFGLGGAVGEAVSSFFFGMFGALAYVFPICLFFGTAFYFVNQGNKLARRKVLGGTAFFWLFCAFMQLLTIGYEKGAAFSDYYGDSASNHLGGGIAGGVLVKLLGFAFGTVGAYVILVIGMVIAAIVTTQRPLLEPLHKTGTRAYRSAREHHARRTLARREDREQRREEAGRRREEAGRRREERRRREAEQESGTDREPDERKAEAPTLPWDEEDDGLSGMETEMPELVIQRNETSGQAEDTAEPGGNPADRQAKRSGGASAGEEPESAGGSAGQERAKRPHSSKEEIQSGVAGIREEITQQAEAEPPVYRFPPFSLLTPGKKGRLGDSDARLRETAVKLQRTLHNFGVNVTVTNASCGPTVTRYELQPEQGVKVSRIVNLADDIKLNLAAADIRIEAPIPGKAAVGIEVPNATNSAVMLRELLESAEFQKFPSSLAFAVGKNIEGKPVIADIAKMPHLLIAGATGSGKSVCINTLIMSILYKAKPEEVKLIMIDPKVVELSAYNGIPHLFIPVVTDPKKAAGALNWAVAEMMERYDRFAAYNVRDLKGYNAKIDELLQHTAADLQEKPEKLPQIVIIVDELADLMMVAPGEVEDAICRLAQLARAAGIHLIIATQRPSVNVITGLIKANMPSRIAFAVSSGVDSRTILDMNGAEKLLGKGDMLFYPQGYQKPARLQGAFVSDREVAEVVEFLTRDQEGASVYDSEIQKKIESSAAAAQGGAPGGSDDRDAYFADAGKFIIEKDKASIGMLQRVFKIGFNRAARIMDQLCEAGVVGEEEGTKPRKVLMSMEQFENYLEQS